MAQVSLVFEDGPDGRVVVRVEFNPAMKRNKKKATPAQVEAMRLLMRIKNEHPDEFEAGLADAE